MRSTARAVIAVPAMEDGRTNTNKIASRRRTPADPAVGYRRVLLASAKILLHLK